MRHDESMKGVIYNHIHDLKFTRAYKQNTANSFVLKIHVVCVYGVGLGFGGGLRGKSLNSTITIRLCLTFTGG